MATTDDLNQEKQFLLDKMENTNENMFITGKAGTGKSYLLKHFLDTTKKNAVVLAPTGIAALNVGGSTIHKFFGLKPQLQVPKKINKSVIYGERRDLFRKIDTLIIDEISMVRVDLLDAIDYILRCANSTNEYFGGKQIIVFGDLYQLPPILRKYTDESDYIFDHYGGKYFFYAPAFQDGNFKKYELQEIFRQSDDSFIEILNHVRDGEVTEDDIASLNKKVTDNSSRSYKDDYITITTTNANAEVVNRSMLGQINKDEHCYYSRVEGTFFHSDYPTEEALVLKPGAHVMMLNNDADDRWVNGSLATVVKCGADTITVRIKETGNTCIVESNEWKNVSYSYDREEHRIVTDVAGKFTQLPVKLAWAITIHKSQGQTYEKAEIDFGRGAFDCGQAYVALSRVKSLDGLILKRPIRPSDIMVDMQVKRYMNGEEEPQMLDGFRDII